MTTWKRTWASCEECCMHKLLNMSDLQADGYSQLSIMYVHRCMCIYLCFYVSMYMVMYFKVIADMTPLSELPALEAAEDAALNETDVSYFRWANLNRAASVSQVFLDSPFFCVLGFRDFCLYITSSRNLSVYPSVHPSIDASSYHPSLSKSSL